MQQPKPQLTSKATQVGNDVQRQMDQLQKSWQALLQHHQALMQAGKAVDPKAAKRALDELRRTCEQHRRTLEDHGRLARSFVVEVESSKRLSDQKQKVDPKKAPTPTKPKPAGFPGR